MGNILYVISVHIFIIISKFKTKINVKRTNTHADCDIYLLFFYYKPLKLAYFYYCHYWFFCGILILVDSHLRL